MDRVTNIERIAIEIMQEQNALEQRISQERKSRVLLEISNRVGIPLEYLNVNTTDWSIEDTRKTESNDE